MNKVGRPTEDGNSSVSMSQCAGCSPQRGRGACGCFGFSIRATIVASSGCCSDSRWPSCVSQPIQIDRWDHPGRSRGSCGLWTLYVSLQSLKTCWSRCKVPLHLAGHWSGVYATRLYESPNWGHWTLRSPTDLCICGWPKTTSSFSSPAGLQGGCSATWQFWVEQNAL